MGLTNLSSKHDLSQPWLDTVARHDQIAFVDIIDIGISVGEGYTLDNYLPRKAILNRRSADVRQCVLQRTPEVVAHMDYFVNDIFVWCGLRRIHPGHIVVILANGTPAEHQNKGRNACENDYHT